MPVYEALTRKTITHVALNLSKYRYITAFYLISHRWDDTVAWTFSLCRTRILHGPLARYVKLRVVHAPGMLGMLSQPPRVSNPDMHVPWCKPGSLTSGFPWSRWRGKRSRHSRRMLNPHFTHLVRGPWPISRLFTTLRCEELGHQKPWYWPSLPGIFRFEQQKSYCGCVHVFAPVPGVPLLLH